MIWSNELVFIAIFAISFLVIALGSFIARAIIRAVMGHDVLERKFPIGWRFSIRSIGLLTIVLAFVFAALREMPSIAISGAFVVTALWLILTWAGEIRRAVAERRTKSLESILASTRPRETRHGETIEN